MKCSRMVLSSGQCLAAYQVDERTAGLADHAGEPSNGKRMRQLWCCAGCGCAEVSNSILQSGMAGWWYGDQTKARFRVDCSVELPSRLV